MIKLENASVYHYFKVGDDVIVGLLEHSRGYAVKKLVKASDPLLDTFTLSLHESYKIAEAVFNGVIDCEIRKLKGDK